MIKLLFRLSYGEIMEVGEGRNFGIPQIPWCIFEFSVDFPAVVFFNGCLRLVFSRFFDIRENLGNVKKKRIFIFPLVHWLKKSGYSSLWMPVLRCFYESVKEVTKRWKKVLLNVQNIRTNNFNLVKSLKNTCKWVYFFTKNELSQIFVSKYYSLYFILPCSNTLTLRDTAHSFSVSSRLHLTQLSSFVNSKLIKLE